MKALLFIVLCLSVKNIYSQGTTDTFLLHYIDTSKFHYEAPLKSHTVTFFLPVVPDSANSKNFLPSAYIIVSLLDTTLKEIWQSGECHIINEAMFFKTHEDFPIIRVDIPDSIVKKIYKIKYKAVKYQATEHHRPDDVNIGFGTFSGIKLNIRSNPEGAEAFLIPNRVWMHLFQNQEFSNWKDRLYDYRVNTSYTNTFAYIDETTYVIVFRQGSDYKVIKHFTKPKSVENEQTVFIDLTK